MPQVSKLSSLPNTPHVSVIIPAYNAARYIEETILSALNQTYPNKEIIVVNDGSKDKTEAIVLAMITDYSGLRLINQPNAGVSAARNHGFRTSDGELVAFLDADDVWLPDYLAKIVERFKQSDNPGLVHGCYQTIDELGSIQAERFRGPEGDIFEEMLNGNIVFGIAGTVFRRDVLNTIGQFDEILSTSADHDIFFRVARNYLIGNVPNIVWHYRVHADGMHHNIPLMEHDLIIVYNKLDRLGYLSDSRLRRNAFSKMYYSLAGSWWHYHKNWPKAVQYSLRSIAHSPSNFIRLMLNLS